MTIVRLTHLRHHRLYLPANLIQLGISQRSSIFTSHCSDRRIVKSTSRIPTSRRETRLSNATSNQVDNFISDISDKQRTTSTMSLARSTDPLVWIDCEMTGLDPDNDIILSISCYITDHKLELTEPKGYHAIISTPASVLSSMGEWCIQTHTATGLVDVCQSSSALPASQAATELLEYIQRHIPEPRVALLAGNSVHADKMFLMRKPWTPVLEWLHYRILDVSAIKEGVRRWGSQDVVDGIPKKKLTHSADEDIKESLEEARYYMQLFQKLENS